MDENAPLEFREGPASTSLGWQFGAEAPVLIEESFTHATAPPEMMDSLWAAGWRHFGAQFFRYSLHWVEGELRVVQPLRVDLTRFQPSHGQRRVLRRNTDLEVNFAPPKLDGSRRALFAKHSGRFRENVPPSLEAFLGPTPEVGPTHMVELVVHWEGRLIATSYLDLGREGASSVYAVYDPACGRRSLGIATMLWEMDYARQHGRRYYYPGYAYREPTGMDYKKQFSGCEWYDWKGAWRPLAEAGN